MKKKIALPIIIVASVVAVLLIAVLVLSFIPVKPLSMLDGYSGVEVYNLSAENPQPSNDDTKKLVSDGLKTTQFSVMQAILEGKFNYAPAFKTKLKEDDKEKKEKEKVKLITSEIKALKASETNYMLVFSYKSPKTVKVKGEEVTFDRVKLMVYDTSGEIKKIEAYPYLYDTVNLDPVDPYYEINVIEIYAKTSKLVTSIKDIADVI